jgi:hypothetical protein
VTRVRRGVASWFAARARRLSTLLGPGHRASREPRVASVAGRSWLCGPPYREAGAIRGCVDSCRGGPTRRAAARIVASVRVLRTSRAHRVLHLPDVLAGNARNWVPSLLITRVGIALRVARVPLLVPTMRTRRLEPIGHGPRSARSSRVGQSSDHDQRAARGRGPQTRISRRHPGSRPDRRAARAA